MTQQWCQVTYDLITASACDALMLPVLIGGVLLGVAVTSLSVAIYLTWRYE
jgi:hypothetical protein